MSCCTAEYTYPRGTIEYLRAEVDATVSLDSQEVEMSLDGSTWIDANWIGSPGLSRVVQALIDFGPFYKGEYSVRVRVHDTPEVPIFYVGTVAVA